MIISGLQHIPHKVGTVKHLVNYPFSTRIHFSTNSIKRIFSSIIPTNTENVQQHGIAGFTLFILNFFTCSLLGAGTHPSSSMNLKMTSLVQNVLQVLNVGETVY